MLFTSIKRIVLFLFLIIASTFCIYGQDFSNKGKEFWIPYSYHVGMSGGTGVSMTLYISSDITTTYNVEVFGGASIQSGTINAGQVVTCIVPNTNFINGAGLYTGKTIRVTAEKPVVVYSYITQSAVSGATVCLPTNVLGNEYFSMNFTQVSNQTNSNSYFTIIAVEDNTTVEITPSANTVNGWAAGTVNTVTLNKGQIFQILGTVNNTQIGGLYNGVDLTGSRIRSVSSGSSSCKRIAVFSGAGKMKIGINCSNNSKSSDNLYQQLYPAASWGKSYLTVPSYSRPINYYRIIKKDPATEVYLNGVLVPAASFVNNRYYEFTGNSPNSITADQPISVAQYFTTQNCSSNPAPYDPDMIVLNPVEQNISKVTLVSSNLVATANRQHHIHLIMPNGGTGISSFRVDGNPIPSSSWTVHPQNSNYSYAYLSNVTQGYHTLVSDSGFNALAYGYAAAESYGYSAGANVKDLYQYISIETPSATVNFPATCTGTPFNFSMTFPYQPTSITWDFGASLNAQGITNVTLNNPTPTSTIVVNGKTLYVYKLTTQYTIASAATYGIKVLATNPTPDGCGGEQEINFDLEVLSRPNASFTFSGGCVDNPVQFTSTANTGIRPISSVLWNFGNSNSSTTQNPSHTYSTAGNYTVTYSLITDIGCLSDTASQVVAINPLPTATISGNATTCLNAPQPLVTFTGAGGTVPYTFTYTINGGAPLTVTTTGVSNFATVAVPTINLGTFQYSLVSVSESGTGNCNQTQTGSVTVIINTNPTATIEGTISVCKDAISPQITFTGAAGTPPYTFSYNINNGPTQTISSTASNSTVLLPVPTITTGTFVYNLTGVVDVNNTICSGTPTGSATVTVNPLPTASVAGTATVCLNAPSPAIIFTGANGTAPYTFTYALNGGTPQTVTTTTGNSVQVLVPTNLAGVFLYELISVIDASNTTCSQNQTGSATITVYPTPSATITGTTSVCNGAASPLITFTGANGDAPYTFTYSINGGSAQTVTTTIGNSITVAAPTGTPGTFTYSLVTVSDSNGSLCTQNVSGTAIVTVNPLPEATISGNTSVCLNASEPAITFTGSNATAPYTFFYSINGGPSLTVTTTTGNSVTVSVPTSTPGTYVYTLQSVTDASNTTCSQPQLGSVIVTVWPLPIASYVTNSPVCQEGIISFTDQSIPNVGTITNWQWNFDDPASGVQNTSTLQNPTHQFSTAGTFAVSLTVTTSNGCVSTNTLPALVVYPKPLAGFIIPEVCLNDTYAQFTDTSSVASPGSVTAWQWNFGNPNATPANPNTSVVQNPQHSYSSVGSYQVELIISTNHGCKDTISQQLVVNGSFPVANFSVNQPSTLCANDSVRITDASTVFPGVITKIEIWWDNLGDPTNVFIENNPAAGQVFSHRYANFQSPLTKTYQIRYRAYSGGVCMNEKLTTITVNAAPAIQFNTLPPICFDAPPYSIIEANETGGVPGVGIFNGPGVSSGGVFSPAVAGAGIHTLQYLYTSTTGNCKDSATQTIKVWERAVADFRVETIPVCERQPVSFSDNSSSTEGTLTEWRWDFGDGTPVVIRNSPAPFTHTFNTFGDFTVSLKVLTSNGCVSAEKTRVVSVNPLARPNFSFPVISCLPNANVQFTNTSTVPNASASTLTYLWNFGDPGSGLVNTATSVNPSHVYVALGPYSVNLQATTAEGCVHDTTIVLNTIHPQPQASFNTNFIDVCVGSPFLLTSTSDPADGTIGQYNWNLGDGSIRNLGSFSYTC
jgi:PKD repeat protein